MLLVVMIPRTQCQKKEPRRTGTVPRAWRLTPGSACDSPRFHEPEDHPDVADSLVGQGYGKPETAEAVRSSPSTWRRISRSSPTSCCRWSPATPTRSPGITSRDARGPTPGEMTGAASGRGRVQRMIRRRRSLPRPGAAGAGSGGQDRLHALADRPAVAIQVEVVPLPAERLLDDGVDHLHAEEEEAHHQDHRHAPRRRAPAR